jgi:Tfp pilus assembly protein PilP
LVFEKEPWVKGWLTEGGPSIVAAHAAVPVAPAVKLEADWSLAGQDFAEPSGAVVPMPWPKTDWAQMRLVGRWVRGQQVVALVAVDGMVHAVVPGMRLGPQQHEVVQVTMDGVWVATPASDGRPRRVLHWSDDQGGGQS